MRKLICTTWILSVGLLGHCRDVHAQGADSAAAEGLFQEGKTLLQGGHFDSACPKLAESYRLEPATGTLLAVAMCHEGQGKLASAWAEYSEVAARSKREGRNDRERAARDKAEALHGKLSHLIIQLSTEARNLPGLQIKRDGQTVGSGALDAAIPVDAGQHVIEATAPGKEPFSIKIQLDSGGDRKEVVIPQFADSRTDSAAPTASPANSVEPKPAGQASTNDAANPQHSGWTTMQYIGAAAAGVGVVGVGIGGYFGLRAISKKSDSSSYCSSDGVCSTADAYDARQEAAKSGRISTAAFIAGGVLAAGGITLYFAGRNTKTEKATALKATPYAMPGALGISVGGLF